jgi:hypothetical protein
MPTKLSSANSSKDSATNTEPVAEVLTQISLAAATIVDQTKLIAQLFDGAQNKLPYDVRTAIATLPSPAMAGDQLLSLTRVAQRWNTRSQTAHERLVRVGAQMVFFGRQSYIRLSNLLAIEETLSGPIKPYPSRLSPKVREPRAPPRALARLS